MSLISTDDVQAWFTDDRLLLEITDDLPEEPNVSTEVLSTVAARYDTSTWTTRTTTPQLIRSIISAQVAAIRYRKHYADQIDELPYADWLDQWAMTILKGIVGGSIALLDIPSDDLQTAQIAASMSGLPDDDSEAAKFTMDMTF